MNIVQENFSDWARMGFPRAEVKPRQCLVPSSNTGAVTYNALG